MKDRYYGRHSQLWLTALMSLYFSQIEMANFRPKDLVIKSAGPCANGADNAITFDSFDFIQIARNQFIMDTFVRVKEDIEGEIQFKMLILVCALDKRHCSDVTLTQANVCKRFADRGVIWSPFFDSISPPFRCPLHKGTYHIRNGTFDLSLITHIPLEPQNIYVNMTFNNRNSNQKVLHQIFCFDASVIITQSRNRRPPKH